MTSISIDLDLPTDISHISHDLRVKYLKDRSTSDHKKAVTNLFRSLYPKEYKIISRHSTAPEYISIILDHFSYLDKPNIVPLVDRIPRGGQEDLYFPAARMEFSSIREFAIADDYYRRLQNGQPHEVYKNAKLLLAALGRPKGSEERRVKRGDNRIPIISSHQIRSLADNIPDKVAMVYAPAAIQLFTGVKLYIAETFMPLLKNNSATAAPAIDLKWHGHVMTVAESGVFGHHVDEVYQENMYTFIAYIIKKNDEAHQVTSRV